MNMGVVKVYRLHLEVRVLESSPHSVPQLCGSFEKNEEGLPIPYIPYIPSWFQRHDKQAHLLRPPPRPKRVSQS